MLFQRFRKIGAAYQQAKRVRDIAGVLLKYGYDDLALRLALPRAARFPFKRMRGLVRPMQRSSQAPLTSYSRFMRVHPKRDE